MRDWPGFDVVTDRLAKVTVQRRAAAADATTATTAALGGDL